MDNISYHGTSESNARQITGPPMAVNVDKGKGELGKGFYTGSSISLAAIWAQTRFKDKGVVIEFEIPKEIFVRLKGKVIRNRENVVSKWQFLKAQGKSDSHTFDADYIIAPFATIEEVGHQLKFESKNAEVALNTSKINIYPCV